MSTLGMWEVYWGKRSLEHYEQVTSTNTTGVTVVRVKYSKRGDVPGPLFRCRAALRMARLP